MTETMSSEGPGGVLGDLLRQRASDKLYACIRDLVANGLDPARFREGEVLPSRQDVTHYLAAWSRHAGLDREESAAWLIDFCCEKLAVLSKGAPSDIRHSTKGVLKYTYESNVPFVCECADNAFRADCRSDCPVREPMKARLVDIEEGRVPAKEYYQPEGWGVPSVSATGDGDDSDSADFGLDKETIDGIFLDLDMEPFTDDPVKLKRRLRLICEVWAYVEDAYSFLKLAHFLEHDPSTEAQELCEAALRTAWRKPSAEGDPWDDAWWYEAVDAMADPVRAEKLRRFAKTYSRE